MLLGALVGGRLALLAVAVAAIVVVTTVAVLLVVLLVRHGGRDGGESGDDDGLELHGCGCLLVFGGIPSKDCCIGIWKECMLLVGSEWMSL